jgi:penicillin-binding protein 1A
MFITRIEDRNGNIIKDFTPVITQSISEDLAYQMTFMLMGSTQDPNATSTTVANYGIGESIMKNNEIAAKTGTTQYNADAWFMGYTQNLASGVWVGGDTWATRFESIAYGQGAVMALPVWAKFYEKLYAHPELSRRYPKTTFEKPEEISVELNCGKMAPVRARRPTSTRGDSRN